jgi:hypothetical protein
MTRTAVKIMHRASQKLVPATLISGVSIRQAQLVQSDWEAALKIILKNVPPKDWPEHSGWDWERKHRKYGRLSAYKFYGIECDTKMQGLLLLSTLMRTSKIKEESGKQIIYGVYLASAPWNLKHLAAEPVYSLVGSVLIATAIQVSRIEDCEGRFGLHSLKQSEEFYRNCGMTDLGSDEDHIDQLRYFEMTTGAAAEFLSGGE